MLFVTGTEIQKKKHIGCRAKMVMHIFSLLLQSSQQKEVL